MASSNGGGRAGGAPRISDMSLASFIVPKASKKGDTERDSLSPHVNNSNSPSVQNQILRARMASEQPRRNSAADFGSVQNRGSKAATASTNRGVSVSVSDQQRRANTLNNLRNLRHNNATQQQQQQRVSEVNNYYVPRRESKENYCYYDAATRGFIYDFEGTRGWRKSHPTNKREFDQRLIEQKTKNARENSERYQTASAASFSSQQPSTSSAQQNAPAAVAASMKQQPMRLGGHSSSALSSHHSTSNVSDQKSNVRMAVPQLHTINPHHHQHSTAAVNAQKRPGGIPLPVHLPPPLAASASAAAAEAAAFVKYDAATDGFYYENASADVWRRRQPLNTTTTISSSSQTNNGGGAAQMPQQRASQTNLTQAAVAAAHQFWRMQHTQQQQQQQSQQHTNNNNSSSSAGPLFHRGVPPYGAQKNNNLLYQRTAQHDVELDEFIKHFVDMQMQNKAGGSGAVARLDESPYISAARADYFPDSGGVGGGMFAAPPRERQMSYAEVEDMILSRSAPQANGGGALPLDTSNLANGGGGSGAHYPDYFAPQQNSNSTTQLPFTTLPYSQYIHHRRGASSDLSAYNSASTTTVNSSVSDSPPPLFLQRIHQQQKQQQQLQHQRNLLIQQQQQEALRKQQQQQNEYSYASALLRGCAQAWKTPVASLTNGGNGVAPQSAALADTATLLNGGGGSAVDGGAHRRQQSSETSAEDAYEFWGDADSTSLDGGGGGRQSANENNGWSNFSSYDYLRTLNVGMGAVGEEFSARKLSRDAQTGGDSANLTRGVLKPLQRPDNLNPKSYAQQTPKKKSSLFDTEQFIEDFVSACPDYGVPNSGLSYEDYVKYVLTPTATPTAGVPPSSAAVGGGAPTRPSDLSRCLWPKTADSTATTPSAFAVPPLGGGTGACHFPDWSTTFFKSTSNGANGGGAVTPLASNSGGGGSDENGAALESHLRDIWKCPAF